MTKARNIADLLDANGDVKSASLDNVPASDDASALTTGTLPNARLPNNISDGGTEGTKLASGTTAQRGSTTGQIRFNTTTLLAEYYTGSEFKSLDVPPAVLSISPTSLRQSVLGSSQSIVITGTGFSSTVTIKIIGDDGTLYTPASTTRNSETQVTITTPTNLTNTNEPYDIKLTNISGLNSTLADVLSINDTPVFSTASGSLGTLVDANRASSNLTPISFSDEESTPTVSVTTGSIPAGLTLNSNGTFSGTANAVSSNATSNFTVTATDGSETATRDYSITVSAPVVIDLLIVAGGGGSLKDNAGGGGGGGMRKFTSQNLTGAITYTCTVGAGGVGVNGGGFGNDGADSSFAGSGITTLTATGGGGGSGGSTQAGHGGAGGGSGYIGAGKGGHGNTPSTTPSQGADGGEANTGSPNYAGHGGGGGGASGQTGINGNSQDGGHGGNGTADSITGSSVTYAGGGGASCELGGTGGSGGSGGGGAGRNDNQNLNGEDGTDGLGGGGGATYGQSYYGGSGGDGVVIIRIPTSSYTGTTSGSPTVTTDGSHKVIKFTSTGTYTA
tara:strand:+ start:457 stop:2136 length:1680 start_codon:yes stop_codon:yes gene_type:complete